MVVHQCAPFCNNTCLVHERAIRCMAKYLASTSTYVDLPDGNRRLSTRGVVYHPDKEKFIQCYVDTNFSGGWAQTDTDNAENVMSCTGYEITYAGCPLFCCSNLQTEIDLVTIEAEYIALSQVMRGVIPFYGADEGSIIYF